MSTLIHKLRLLIKYLYLTKWMSLGYNYYENMTLKKRKLNAHNDFVHKILYKPFFHDLFITFPYVQSAKKQLKKKELDYYVTHLQLFRPWGVFFSCSTTSRYLLMVRCFLFYLYILWIYIVHVYIMYDAR